MSKPEYTCPYCKWQTHAYQNLRVHITVEHRGEPMVGVARAKGNLDLPHAGPFECPRCGDERPDLQAIRTHIDVMHKIEDTEVAEYGITRMLRRFECELGFEAWLAENGAA